MSEDTGWVVMVVAGIAGVVAAAVLPTYIVVHNATVRQQSCVEAGGSYLVVPNTSKMECRR